MNRKKEIPLSFFQKLFYTKDNKESEKMEKEERKEEKVEENNSEKKETHHHRHHHKHHNKKRTPIIILIVVIIVVVISVAAAYQMKNKDNKESKTIKTDSKTVKSEYRMSGNSLENFDLYFLKLENTPGNKIYSPLSIKYALEMLSEGANGETKKQLDAVIGDYKARSYPNNEHMSFANAMFIRDSFKEKIQEAYTKTLKTKYNAEVIYDPFETPNTMNDWISSKTFKLIENLLGEDDIKGANFFLVNALAIDMNWNNLIQCAPTETNLPCIEYNAHYNHESYSDFISAIYDDNHYPTMEFNGKENIKSVEIGASFNNYNIVKELGEENIRKTVGDEYEEFLSSGGCGNDLDTNSYLDKYIRELNENYLQVDISTDYSMYTDDEIKVFAKDLQEYDGMTLQYVGIMPKEKSLETFIEETDADKLKEIISNLKELKAKNFKDGVVTQIKGNIPLFNFEYKLNLEKDLQELGIQNIFDVNKSDLSNMLKDEKQMISASHKANIEFSNEGIKAAAVTVLGGYGSASCGFEHLYDVPVETIDLTFDKPYLFIIRDKATGEIWFTGTVYEPTIQ